MYWYNKELFLAKVQQNGKFLLFGSLELCNDKEVVLAAVQQDGGALKYASKDLQDDKELQQFNIEGISQNYKKFIRDLPKNVNIVFL